MDWGQQGQAVEAYNYLDGIGDSNTNCLAALTWTRISCRGGTGIHVISTGGSEFKTNCGDFAYAASSLLTACHSHYSPTQAAGIITTRLAATGQQYKVAVSRDDCPRSANNIIYV